MFVKGEFIPDNRLLFAAICGRCGAEIGNLEPGELGALVSGRYGKLLCFACEDNSCPSCQKDLMGDDGEDDRWAMQNFGVCHSCYIHNRLPNPGFMCDYPAELWLTEKGFKYVNSQR